MLVASSTLGPAPAAEASSASNLTIAESTCTDARIATVLVEGLVLDRHHTVDEHGLGYETIEFVVTDGVGRVGSGHFTHPVGSFRAS
ncbi:hypothetical protein GCM10020360_31260 [Nonlabens tegetincola]